MLESIKWQIVKLLIKWNVLAVVPVRAQRNDAKYSR